MVNNNYTKKTKLRENSLGYINSVCVICHLKNKIIPKKTDIFNLLKNLMSLSRKNKINNQANNSNENIRYNMKYERMRQIIIAEVII